MLLFYDSMKSKSKARKNTTKNKLPLGRVSLDRMEPAADKGYDKTIIDQRKETGSGVKEEEEGIPRQLGEREKKSTMIKRARKEKGWIKNVSAIFTMGKLLSKVEHNHVMAHWAAITNIILNEKIKR